MTVRVSFSFTFAPKFHVSLKVQSEYIKLSKVQLVLLSTMSISVIRLEG